MRSKRGELQVGRQIGRVRERIRERKWEYTQIERQEEEGVIESERTNNICKDSARERKKISERIREQENTR